MDNFSQETEKIENSEPAPDNLKIEDIKFEEVIDINDIQKKLSEKVNPETEGVGKVQAGPSEANEITESPESIVKKEILIDPNTKKYVIYIDPENINFIEHLSIKERKSVINKILKEQNEYSAQTKRQQEINRFIKHALLACFTAVICFPVMLVVVNKALEVTINNYGQARQNFMRLYKEEGKIKMQNSASVSNIKY